MSLPIQPLPTKIISICLMDIIFLKKYHLPSDQTP